MKTFFSILFCSLFLSPAKGNKPTIVFLIAEREYQTEETLPVFAKEKLEAKYITRYCTAEKEGSNRHVLRNAGAIETAHLLFVSVRRRAFSDKTMGMIRKHVADGKPVIGIRTASHAFALRKETPPDGTRDLGRMGQKNHGRELRRALRPGKTLPSRPFSFHPRSSHSQEPQASLRVPSLALPKFSLARRIRPTLARNDRGGSFRTACLDEPIALRRQNVLHLTRSLGGLQETRLQQASFQRRAMVP